MTEQLHYSIKLVEIYLNLPLRVYIFSSFSTFLTLEHHHAI